MLINIPKSISPNLLKILAEMGHGDEVAIVDSNFPAKSLKGKTIYNSEKNILVVLKDIFYEKAKESYAIVSTNDESLYGCLIIRKGIISEFYK